MNCSGCTTPHTHTYTHTHKRTCPTPHTHTHTHTHNTTHSLSPLGAPHTQHAGSDTVTTDVRYRTDFTSSRRCCCHCWNLVFYTHNMRAVTHSRPTYDAQQTTSPPDAAAAAAGTWCSTHTQHVGSDTHTADVRCSTDFISSRCCRCCWNLVFHTHNTRAVTHSRPTYDAQQTSSPPDDAAAAAAGTWCTTHTTCGQ